MKKLCFVLSSLAFFNLCCGQITIVDSASTANQVNLNGTYTQNFDSLASSTSSGGTAWVNNSTIPGWYSNPSSYSADNAGPGLLSTGSLNDSDRSLGSRYNSWALRFVNSSSQTITGFNISYTGEQWYRGANDPQGTDRMFFDYLKYSASTSEAYEIYNIGGVGRVDVPELRFSAPNQTDPNAGILDGNLAESQYFVTYFLTGINVAPGEKIWFRWSTGDTLNFDDHAMATDDVQVSFISTIPEPSSYAAFAAVGTLAAAMLRRKRTIRP